MNSSPLSPTSPLLLSSLTREDLRQHLELEERLQLVGEELLEDYKRTKQWKQVGQLAQTLSTNSNRISSLTYALNPTSSSFTFDEMEGTPPLPTVSVKSTEQCCWLVSLSSSEPAKRKLEDFQSLRAHLITKYSLQIPSLAPDVSASVLEEMLYSAVKDVSVSNDSFLNCFLSPNIDDFALVYDSGKENKPLASVSFEEVLSPDHVEEMQPSPSNEIIKQSASANTEKTISSEAVNQESSEEKEKFSDEVPALESSSAIDTEEEIKAMPDNVATPLGSNLTEPAVPIEELENSPHVPKRLASPPHFMSNEPSLPVSTSPVSADSTVPPSPSTLKAIDQLKSVANKTESSSDEIASANDEDKPQSKIQGFKQRSMSMFYDKMSVSPPQSKPLSKKGKTIKKAKKESVDVTVSLVAPQSTIDWDPTCLLEELYSDCHPSTAHSSTGENARHSGYLDKLPVNQRKPTVMKGWKHRFFRLTRGSLFYYDDASSTKATSFIRLSDSKIVAHQDSLKVEIIEKGSGNFIMLRAESKEDLISWQRVLQLEAVHPTMTHRLSLSPTRSSPILIVDLGSSSVRAGLLSDNTYPQLFFPNVCAFSDERIIACGNDALLPRTRSQVKLIHPCRHRLRLDSTLPMRDCYQFIMETICKLLQLEPQNASVLVCVSPVLSESEQITLVEVILEVLGFKAALLQEQTTMALYSYNNTSGIVVNVGDSTNVVPIIDGFKVDSGSSHTPFGGQSVTESLSKLATAKDIRYFSEAEMYIVRYIKENICFVSQDFPGDTIKCEESPTEYIRAVDVDRFQLPDHKKVIHLDSALFKAPEGLFTPGLWGKDIIGIHEMVQKAIDHCPLDMRRHMSRNIYLAGGTTLLYGFQERLQKELELMFPRMEVIVHANENRQHAAFLGAGVLASLNSFSKSLVDIDTWCSRGLEAMKGNT